MLVVFTFLALLMKRLCNKRQTCQILTQKSVLTMFFVVVVVCVCVF